MKHIIDLLRNIVLNAKHKLKRHPLVRGPQLNFFLRHIYVSQNLLDRKKIRLRFH